MENKLETLPKDILFQLAIGMELPELLNLCKTHPNLNVQICKNRDIWSYKLQQNFKEYLNFEKYPQFKKYSSKKLYQLLYG